MLNNGYLELSSELAAESSTLFQDGDEKESLNFLKKYLRYIESDNACYNRLFLLEDPSENRKTRKIAMLDFNLRVHRFLERLLRHGNKILKKTYKEGEVACFLGVAYEYGLFGMYRNSEMAYRHYTIAAQLKSSLGTFRLALCHERGFGTDRSHEKAVYFFRCSAKLGLLDGMHVYGIIVANGHLGCEPDPETGLHFLSLASLKADAEYPYALYDIGNWYNDKTKTHFVSPDNGYAVKIYMKGAELGEPNCQYKLAEIYELGEYEVKPNIEQAIKYYRLASENGQADAQVRLSEIYFTGIPGFLPRTQKESYMWALRAASNLNSRGALIVGEYAYKGFGTRKDVLCAWWWFIISEKLGNLDAPFRVKDLTREILKTDDGIFRKKKCFELFCFSDFL